MIGVRWQEPAAEPIVTLPPVRVPAREIIAEVAALYGLTAEDLTGDGRCRAISQPRQHAMWAVRKRAPHLSLPQIGKALGGRDHTTILHGIRRHQALLDALKVAA